jgi:hypothetical protein
MQGTVWYAARQDFISHAWISPAFFLFLSTDGENVYFGSMDFFLHQVERVIFIFLQDLLAHEWFFFVFTDGGFLLRNINICFLSPPIEKC